MTSWQAQIHGRVGPPRNGTASTTQPGRPCLTRAIRLQKALIRQWEDLPLKDAIAAGADALAAAFETDEPARAMAAFQAARRARARNSR